MRTLDERTNAKTAVNFQPHKAYTNLKHSLFNLHSFVGLQRVNMREVNNFDAFLSNVAAVEV